MKWTTLCMFAASAAALVAQTPPVSILEIDTEDVVFYHYDVGDPSKFGSVSAATTAAPAFPQLALRTRAGVGDIVTVNGKSVKGVWTYWAMNTLASARYTPGRPIADRAGNCMVNEYLLILGPDGTEIGTVVTNGLGTPVAPPGSPGAAAANNMAVVGGTGAFLGVRGQMSVVSSSGVRHASMLEDPANRRINGGGKRRLIIHLIPMSWPEVMTLPSGPAILHGDDWSPVTAEKPARAGELLIMSASGLGPVKPKLDPGEPFPPFPESELRQVNSPVDVVVNGREARVVNKIGWPTMTNVYRVDFVVPDGTEPGMATVGLSVAWVNAPDVKIPVK